MARGDYNNPKPVLGQIEANHPLELLCLDLTKIDPASKGKENVLVLTDVFTKFSLVVVTSNQKALTVAKVLVDKWFHMQRYTAIKENLLTTRSSGHSVNYMVLNKQPLVLIIPGGTHSASSLIALFLVF